MIKHHWFYGIAPALLFATGPVFGATDISGLDGYSTPPGITLIDVMHLHGEWTYQWTRLGDAKGNTLYVSDNDTVPGMSHCTGECAETFPPVIAANGAQAEGDWSLVVRGDGKLQWAYRNKPLYRFTKETRIHEVVNNVLARELAKDNILRKAAVDETALLPPAGWRVARLNPAADMAMPAGIAVRNLPWNSSHGLVANGGMTLYVLGGDVNTVTDQTGEFVWQPLYAPALARSVGLFSPLLREDGRKQWTFRGAPLFTFSGDYDPGDVNGVAFAAHNGDSRWQLAALKRHYTPERVKVRDHPVFGRLLFNAEGKPLYSRNPLEIQRFYHRNMVYQKGKLLGAKGCDALCEKTWQPFWAPEGAQSQGYWEVLARPDGRTQWMYKGHALYTYAKDKTDGVVNGNNIYDYVIGDSGRYKIADVMQDHNGINISAALYWLVVMP